MAASTIVDATRPQRQTTTDKHLEKRSGGKCGQQASGLDEGRWRLQYKAEWGGDEWSGASCKATADA